ncbi:TadE/TadG family type IV pilus assembly protein [Yersinia enterocolitica]|uniref:TadE/TadG family type IV pilus assembly protein n=1 Tax=Yersinia enterocolitica TaxID=630 RepID=UPI000657EA31|nr:TadE/TadG family type IV pilus assembly protein [Yersinia enterocolitica]CRX70746.1 putative tight adherance operon protein [Yersinia enterocolitica]
MNGNVITFFRSNNGSIAIEFLIVFTLFIFILLSSAEITRLLYISSNLDLAFSKAVKTAKNRNITDNRDYNTILRQRLIAQTGVFGAFIADSNIVTDVAFSNSINDIINNVQQDNNNLALAKYTVSYTYKAIFFPIPTIFANTLLRREVIFVQEH